VKSLNEQINHQMWSEVPDQTMTCDVDYKASMGVMVDFVYQIMEQILNKLRDEV
jgi:hypothetical protein